MVKADFRNQDCSHNYIQRDLHPWRRHAGYLHSRHHQNRFRSRNGRPCQQRPDRRGRPNTQGAPQDQQRRDHDHGRERERRDAQDEVRLFRALGGAACSYSARRADATNRRSRADYGVFVLDTETSECLHYEAAVGYPPTRHVRVPRDVLAEHPEVEIRNDLIDCSIDVCSVEVRLCLTLSSSRRIA